MAFRRYVIAVLVFVVFVGGAFAMFQVADAGSDSAARTAENVTNESINQQVGIWQYVNKSTQEHTAGFNETVTVYNSNDQELTKGEDYQWNATDGAIKYENTASVTDGETGNISYAYFENTQDVKGLSSIIDPIVAFVGRGGLLAGGLGLVVVLLAFGALIARYIGDSGPQTNR